MSWMISGFESYSRALAEEEMDYLINSLKMVLVPKSSVEFTL